MPDRYDLALIPRTDLHASNFVAIAARSWRSCRATRTRHPGVG
jgi:hypothetical protein